MPDIAELVSQFDTGPQPQAAQARQQLRELVWQAGVGTQPAARLAMALAAELGKPHSANAKSLICELVSLVGQADVVPALAAVLADEQNREMARWALDRIAAPEAVKALADAARHPNAEFRSGVLASLAGKGADAESTIQGALEDADVEVRLAAAEALANFPTAENDARIQKTAGDSPRGKKRAAIARIRLAEKLAAAGSAGAAKEIYRAVAASEAESPQRAAAELALRKLG